MSKILTDAELAEIVTAVVKGGVINEKENYEAFLLDLGTLLGNHLGAECVNVSSDKDDENEATKTVYCAHFKATESTPPDGGVFADFDTDLSVEKWIKSA